MVGAPAGRAVTSFGPEQSLRHSGPTAAVSQSGFPSDEPVPQAPLGGLAAALSPPHCHGRELCRPAVFPSYRLQGFGLATPGYTSGFKRVAQDFYQRHDRPKELWVKELDRRAWCWLRAQPLPLHLARYEKSTPPACVGQTQQMPSLFERFNQVADWRQRIGKRHGLPTVL